MSFLVVYTNPFTLSMSFMLVLFTTPQWAAVSQVLMCYSCCRYCFNRQCLVESAGRLGNKTDAKERKEEEKAVVMSCGIKKDDVRNMTKDAHIFKIKQFSVFSLGFNYLLFIYQSFKERKEFTQ